jgi:hypothetical protein
MNMQRPGKVGVAFDALLLGIHLVILIVFLFGVANAVLIGQETRIRLFGYDNRFEMVQSNAKLEEIEAVRTWARENLDIIGTGRSIIDAVESVPVRILAWLANVNDAETEGDDR